MLLQQGTQMPGMAMGPGRLFFPPQRQQVAVPLQQVAVPGFPVAPAFAHGGGQHGPVVITQGPPPPGVGRSVGPPLPAAAPVPVPMQAANPADLPVQLQRQSSSAMHVTTPTGGYPPLPSAPPHAAVTALPSVMDLVPGDMVVGRGGSMRSSRSTANRSGVLGEWGGHVMVVISTPELQSQEPTWTCPEFGEFDLNAQYESPNKLVHRPPYYYVRLMHSSSEEGTGLTFKTMILSAGSRMDGSPMLVSFDVGSLVKGNEVEYDNEVGMLEAFQSPAHVRQLTIDHPDIMSTVIAGMEGACGAWSMKAGVRAKLKEFSPFGKFSNRGGSSKDVRLTKTLSKAPICSSVPLHFGAGFFRNSRRMAYFFDSKSQNCLNQYFL